MVNISSNKFKNKKNLNFGKKSWFWVKIAKMKFCSKIEICQKSKVW